MKFIFIDAGSAEGTFKIFKGNDSIFRQRECPMSSFQPLRNHPVH